MIIGYGYKFIHSLMEVYGVPSRNLFGSALSPTTVNKGQSSATCRTKAWHSLVAVE